MPEGRFSQGRAGLGGYQTGPAPRGFAGDQLQYFDPSAMWDALMQMRKEPNPDPIARSGPLRSTAQAQRPGLNPLFQNMDTLQGMRQDFYGQRIGSNPRFADMLPAAALAGIDLMQGRKTGWDQYADIAAGGNMGPAGHAAMTGARRGQEQDRVARRGY